MQSFRSCLLLVLIACMAQSYACMPEALPEEVADGVIRQAVFHEHSDGHLSTVWLYYPNPMPEGPMSLIVVPPAGGTFVSAPSLSAADQPEHIPYVRAGHAVVSFSIRGELGRLETEDDDIVAFINGRAGVDDAMFALDTALSRLNVDDDHIYAAGHSSAGTLALILALEDKRIDGVIAYAAATDLVAHFGDDLIDEVTAGYDLDFRGFIEWSSPLERVDEYALPMFLFMARHDPKMDLADYLYFIGSTGAQAKVFSEVVDGSDHYQTMIDSGIPKAMQWIEAQED